MSYPRVSVVNRGTTRGGSNYNVTWDRSSPALGRGTGRGLGGGGRRGQGFRSFSRMGRGGRGSGTYSDYSSGHLGDVAYWRKKLDSDSKLFTFQTIEPFRRMGVCCHPHWASGLAPITKFLVQDLFETLQRTVNQYEQSQLTSGWSNEEGARARAGSL